MRGNYLAMLLLCLSCLCWADDASRLAAAKRSLVEDIAAAKHELAEQQLRLQQERGTMLAEMGRLRTANTELERQVAEHVTATDELKIATGTLQAKTATVESELAQADKALVNARRSIVGELPPGRQQLNADLWEGWDAELPAGEPISAESYTTFFTILQGEVEHWRNGQRYATEAVLPDGQVVPGDCASVGPITCFVSKDGHAGLTKPTPGHLLPSLIPMPDHAAGIVNLISSGQGVVPFDPTEGDASKLAQTEDTLVQHLMKGGVVMVPLLLLALVAFCLALFKFISLVFVSAQGTEPRIADILVALKANRVPEAFAIAKKLRKPLGPVICEGLEHRDAPKEHIEELMYERIMAQVPSLESMLSPLAVCASVAPLLGLLGTVTGIIHTFRVITAFGAGNAQALSGGISEALITTEVGLMIAVPALLLHAWMSRRVRKAVAATQQSAIMFVNGLKLRTEENDTNV